MNKIFKIFFLITFLIIFSNKLLYATDRSEINTIPVLNPKLIFDKNSSDTLRNLSQEYLNVYKKQSFDKNFHNKINVYIDLNKHSYTSLSALLMLTSMCFLENNEVKYSEYGEKIINFIISKYPKTVQGKISLILLAQTQSEEGNDNEAFKILHDNYEIILSAEKDPYYNNYLYELNFENNDSIAAEYFFLLGNIYFHLNKDENAIIEFNKIIDHYPNSTLSTASKRVIKAINALNKSL